MNYFGGDDNAIVTTASRTPPTICVDVEVSFTEESPGTITQ